jgi:lipid-A-disaccharide synthase-like uncharacterized protein
MLGQATGLIVYARNLVLITKKKNLNQEKMPVA